MSDWCIIIPYRDREAHLKRFVEHYKPIFPDVPIIVVEQQAKTPFNRAKLLNVGFLEEGKKYLWAAYHDVDMYVFPEYAKCYTFPEMPTHIATRCEQFGFKIPYIGYSGGIILINTEQFEASGGFSNHFWSWGIEDDEMRNNLHSFGFEVNHVECYFHCEDHERKIEHRYYRRGLSLLKNGRRKDADGIHHCQYRVKNREERDGYILIQVNI